MISRTPAERAAYNTRQKAMRDHIWRLRAARDEGLTAGREKGREEGREIGELIGRISVLQQVLGESDSQTLQLADLPVERLRSRAEQLTEMLKQRGLS